MTNVQQPEPWAECLECPTCLPLDNFLNEWGGRRCPECESAHVVDVDPPADQDAA